jgi:hypothetical protein
MHPVRLLILMLHGEMAIKTTRFGSPSLSLRGPNLSLRAATTILVRRQLVLAHALTLLQMSLTVALLDGRKKEAPPCTDM